MWQNPLFLRRRRVTVPPTAHRSNVATGATKKVGVFDNDAILITARKLLTVIEGQLSLYTH